MVGFPSAMTAAAGARRFLRQGVHQRVPAQQGALDAAGVAADAGQADELAQRDDVGSFSPGQNAAKVLLQLCATSACPGP